MITEIRSLTDEELKQVAKDIHANKIFTSNHISPGDAGISQSIFMPLAFLTSEEITEDAINSIGMIYEYYDKAGSRGINGYPSFFSCQFLNKEDTVKIWELTEKIKNAVDGV